ncbi:MAG TPA: oligosaccharide flippase family protein, partial [Candidatus Polarisedimenticolaceae bacterium]|nr:oligosaccharide flippase family protein [Candidatus Polarisedimenticolaceae bacterium]
MNSKQRILRNATFLYGAEIVSRAMTIFLTLLVAHRLGSGEFGKLAFVTATMMLIQMLADFGISTLLIKEVAAD